MVAPKPKMTGPVRLVLDLLIGSAVDREEVWGLRICERTNLGPGTVYPILERLERAGWVTSAQEVGQPHGRPPRRLYEMTGFGRAEYGAALAHRSKRLSRWTAATEFTAIRRGGRTA